MKRGLYFVLGIVAVGCGGGSSSSGGSKPATTVARTVLASGLSQPMQYIVNTANSHLAYVLEREGRVRVMVDDVLASAPVLDITSVVVTNGECGLQGMALAPDFATSGAFYLQYNTNESGTLKTRVTRYTMAGDGLSASPTGSPIFMVDQPYENHKGGTIHFVDNYLYLALGDGGSGNDPENRAQNVGELLGKVLRLDPSGDGQPTDPDNNYLIPSTNPFLRVLGARGEIWDLGMRNPFRWCVDAQTKALIFADVGQDAYEEIDYEPADSGGRNYGWRIREGRHDNATNDDALLPNLTDPFLEYGHSVGRSITGGYIVRGGSLGLGGRYLFADYVTNRLWSVPLGLTSGEAPSRTMADTTEIGTDGGWNGIVSIDPDASGVPVVTELNAGRVSRLVPVPAP